MRLSQAEVYEVASFYDHFDIVKENEPKPAPITIRVCESISCMIAGADQLIEKLSAGVDPSQVRVVRAACVGRCAGAPAARVGDREVEQRDGRRPAARRARAAHRRRRAEVHRSRRVSSRWRLPSCSSKSGRER